MSRHRLLTFVLFGVLGAAALAVFVALPAWVGRPPATPTVTPEPAPVVAAPTPAPEVAEPVPEPPPIAPPPAVPPPASPPAVARRPSPPPPPPAADPFVDAMSAGLEALAGDDLGAARTAFERALTLRPGDAQAADGLAQAKAGELGRALVAHREAGRAAEVDERWSEALARYEAALALDAHVAFAREGRDRARDRQDLDTRLAFHLSHPDRLAGGQVFDEATALLARAREVAEPGPRLRRQVDDLALLLAAWGAPVTVELISDGLTEVAVQPVGPLGSFERRTLDLRPGTYTAVGRRRGFRDVRRRLVVEPGRPPAPLEVRCEEAL